MLQKDKSIFKVGQRVWSFEEGYGIVTDVRDTKIFDYPVIVLFDNDIAIHFTTDGRAHIRCNRTLFFEEIPIPKSALKPKRWRAYSDKEFYYISSRGIILIGDDRHTTFFDQLYESGNYFQTEEEAKNSDLYKVFQSMKEEV